MGLYRLAVLVLSAALLWSAFQFLSIVWGKWPGVIGVILILLLPKYLVLSLSVMAGLPAVTFAMLSLLTLTRWHTGGRRIWLVLSALLLAVSVLTKLFTGFLAPVFLVGIVIAKYSRHKDSRSWLKTLTPAFLWGAVFTGAAPGADTVVGRYRAYPPIDPRPFDSQRCRSFQGRSINDKLPSARALAADSARHYRSGLLSLHPALAVAIPVCMDGDCLCPAGRARPGMGPPAGAGHYPCCHAGSYSNRRGD